MVEFKFYGSPHEFEPLRLEMDDALASKAEALVTSAAKLKGIMDGRAYPAMADLVRGMNCYYSNLIEGHRTLPLDIEKALRNEYSKDQQIHDLQKLAVAHIRAEKALQEMVDKGSDPATPEFLKTAHRIFCEALPESMLVLSDGSKLIPGVWRTREVKVGRHVPPRRDSIPAFLERFHAVFADLKPGMQSLVPIAIAHHRLAWIHPFADGNGRVARLMTDAMLRRYGINEHGLWSLSRGFAKTADNYKAYLASADEPRRGDLDGRGNLSTSALREFVLYLLSTAVDQVEYMTSLFELPTLSSRIDAYITQARRELRPESAKLLKQALAAGELDRGELASITGLHERIARDVAKQLLAEGMLVSDSPRGTLRISFPAKVLGWYFPNLYPAGADDQIEKPEVKGKARRPLRRPS